MIRLPGLTDPHVHMREPGAAHKEDWDSGTSAALAGGFTRVLAMPNTNPPVSDAATLELALDLARSKARCDYAQFLGAGAENAAEAAALSGRAAGLKMYLDQTYGPLRLDEMSSWMDHFAAYPSSSPICIHAEGRSIAAAIFLASLHHRAVHICHVARAEEIRVIRTAKEKGYAVTCEVAPHHLFLSTQDIARLGPGWCEVRPRLASPRDVQALWDNLEFIDCFATDHAPHTRDEKANANPPPGFPGLETALPLLLNAAAEGKLTLEDIILRCHTNPERIFNLPPQPDTWIEVDDNLTWEVRGDILHTRCAWSPFDGMQVRGRIEKVVLRGQVAFEKGHILAQPGYGINIREKI